MSTREELSSQSPEDANTQDNSSATYDSSSFKGRAAIQSLLRTVPATSVTVLVNNSQNSEACASPRIPAIIRGSDRTTISVDLSLTQASKIQRQQKFIRTKNVETHVSILSSIYSRLGITKDEIDKHRPIQEIQPKKISSNMDWVKEVDELIPLPIESTPNSQPLAPPNTNTNDLQPHLKDEEINKPLIPPRTIRIVAPSSSSPAVIDAEKQSTSQDPIDKVRRNRGGLGARRRRQLKYLERKKLTDDGNLASPSIYWDFNLFPIRNWNDAFVFEQIHQPYCFVKTQMHYLKGLLRAYIWVPSIQN